MEKTTMLDQKTTYSDLPIEIIFFIFSYLSHTDRLQAGSTCKRWRDALFESDYKRTGKVHFSRECLSDTTSPGTYLLKSQRSYSTFHFKDATFDYLTKLAAYIGQTAVNVTFEQVDISIEQFRLFMRHATNLKSLTIKRCSDLFLSGLFINDDLEKGEDVTSSFASIRHLSLPDNLCLCDAIFWRITSPIIILESLDMSGCQIAYHNAIYKRYYPNANVPPSDSILTFKFIANVINTHRKHIKELNLSYTWISGTDLQLLAPNEELNFITLNKLKLTGCRQLNTIGITSFLKTQPQLVILDLANTKCVNDDFLKMLVETLPMIEDLNISECEYVTNEGCAHLGTFKRLKRLNIMYCNGINTDGLRRGIARTLNTQLHHLQMSGLNICEEGIKCIALNCLELRQLDVSFCNKSITDTSLKYILQHLRWLRDLSLKGCSSISDAGLTGMNMLANESGTTPNDGAYLCEQFKNDINPTTNRVSIQSLKGLRRLNLDGCFNITDATLVHSIKFAELTDLNLSYCQRISSYGIQSVALNCPSIEKLDLSYCRQINDEDIHFLTRNMNRLKALYINGCSLVTQNALGDLRIITSRETVYKIF